MEGNFKNVKKFIYEGEEYTKVYAGNIQVWKKPSSFVRQCVNRKMRIS
ncbi:hypothetical protein W223_02238 [Staphylococcus aureus DAR1278]|nr:hypothetical protein W223_02238 [Staphylococcus aureus DAR1278]